MKKIKIYQAGLVAIEVDFKFWEWEQSWERLVFEHFSLSNNF